MSEQERAVVFGRDAAAYESARPGYPRAAIEHLTGLADPLSLAVEIGPGTGKATERVARPGLELIGLEPDPDMARVLEEKALPGVRVEVSRFEEWEGSAGEVDLIYAAQSWHWVDQDNGYEHAREVLRPGGVLGLMWNLSLVRYQPFEHIYQRLAPQVLEEQDQRIQRRDNPPWLGEMAANGFRDLQRFAHRWDQELSASGVRVLYSSYSDHILLAEAARELLLDEVEAEVARNGGSLVIEYSTEVFSGRA